ncbi:MAG: Crp/Fnr family transcriptional regulator [Dehalococcoidia bacterium]
MSAAVTNLFLESLPSRERQAVAEAGEVVALHAGDILYQPGEAFGYVYFPLGCVIAITTPLGDGKTVESVTVGREGLAGIRFFLGAIYSRNQVFVQIDGDCLRVPTAAFKNMLEELPVFRSRIGPFTEAFMASMSQSSACLATHQVTERCARWLLMAADRLGAESFRLTQESLAAMLGNHRPTVSLSAAALQSQGLIKYHRGRMEIVDRQGLEAASCECYRVVSDIFSELYGGAAATVLGHTQRVAAAPLE